MVERHTVEEGVDKPEHARELAIQRLKVKQDFKGLVGSNRITEADVQREMERG